MYLLCPEWAKIVSLVESTQTHKDHNDWSQISPVLNVVNVGVFQVEQSKVLIKEGGVQLTLTIVDTPGFGDAVDNSNW